MKPVISLLLLLFSSLALGGYNADYTGYSVSEDTSSVVVTTSNQLRLRFDVVSPGVVRVWSTKNSVFLKKPSYAVLNENFSPSPFSLTDNEENLSLNTAELSVRINKHPLRVDFYNQQGVPVALDDTAKHDLKNGIYRKLEQDEHIYGLGQDNREYLGTLDRKGTRRTLWTGQKIRRGYVTADIPIPFLLSTKGYGLFFDNTYRTVFDLGRSNKQAYSWQADGGEAIYYFIYGPNFPRIIDSYTELTGKPPLPSLWTLGFVQSKCTYRDWPEIDRVVQTLRQKKIPVDGIAIDFDWAEQLQNFRWAERWKGESPARMQSYASQGVNFFISQSGPMIRKDSSNFQDALKNNIFATNGKGETVSCGYYGGELMDFTSPTMKPWLWGQVEHLYQEGVKGWWLDLSEPEGEPTAETYYWGGRAYEIHNVYSLLNSKVYYEMQQEADPNSRVFLLTRTGFAGIQHYAALWTGDIYSDYETLQAQVPAMLNAGLSGVTAWSNDSGGFLEGYYKGNLRDHGLLYERWMQFSAFTPLLRAHHVGLSEPYAFGPQVEETSRHYIQLRYKLLPYIYAYAWQAHQTGLPIARPLILEYQDDPQVYGIKDEYLFGSELLVAPVLAEGATSRSVYFPGGEGTLWMDYDTGERFVGGRSYQVKAPQNKLPLFVKSGAIVPMLQNPMASTQEKPWDPLVFEVFPATPQNLDSSFMAYLDDGRSTNYERGQYTEVELNITRSPDNTLTKLELRASNDLFAPKSYVIRLHQVKFPKRVKVQGELFEREVKDENEVEEEGVFWNWITATLTIKLSGHCILTIDH